MNLYAEYIMKNTGLEETQAGIKIVERNINNLRYADDTTLTKGHCHPRASSAKTRGFHTQLDEGPETP